MPHIAQFKIAEIIIKMQSKFPISRSVSFADNPSDTQRYADFSYRGKERPEILINVEVVEKLPEVLSPNKIFTAYHFQDHSENWSLFKKNNTYIYTCPLKGKKQLMSINKDFNKVSAYLLAQNNHGSAWKTTDIIYDFLQVLLINYLARRNLGIITHAVGIKDLDASGLVFAGKSGAGKSTTARIWYKHTQASVLNDDRVIIRRKNRKFIIYGSPWHGDFSDYLKSKIDSARLKKLFFIYHARKNKLEKMPERKAMQGLYPVVFMPFWEKYYLGNVFNFCRGLAGDIPCYRLGFKNNKRIIPFIRQIIN